MLIDKFLDQFRSKRTLYVKLYKNKVEIKHIETGNSITRVPSKPFSIDRLIIADYEVMEVFLRAVIKELHGKAQGSRIKPYGVVIQVIDEDVKVITPVERRAYRDSFRVCWCYSRSSL
ncbi:MAG: hypothetical protein HRT57_10155 [Crocinitomicaceae bacterium]|nr:hypothetical protein [Crocinitomicaceae bacterium]